MAEFRWRGNGAGTASAYNDGRNWVDSAGSAYIQARYPGSVTGVGDDVVLDQALGEDASGIAGYDGSSNVTLRSFIVGAAYDGTIGSADTWLKINADSVSINAESAQNIYIEGASGLGLEKLSVQSATGLYVKGIVTGADITSGTVDFAASSSCAGSLTIGVGAGGGPAVTLNSGMSLPAVIYQHGGSVTNYNDVVTLNLTNGTWTQAQGDITALRTNGGTCYWNAGNITTANLISGGLDASGSVKSRRVNAVYLYPNATFSMNDKVGSVKITDRIYHYGGTLRVAPNTELQLSTDQTYLGAANAVYGVSPQVVNNTTVNGDGVYLALNDRLDVYCVAGNIATGGSLSFALYEDAVDTFATEAAVSGSGYALAFTDLDGDTEEKITIWGHQLSAGKHYVRIKVVEDGSADCVIAAQYIKHEM